MPFATVRGARLHYTESGSGPAVVFSHGLFWSGRMFAPQIEALRGRYRCIAFDHRGQGQSEVTTAGYEMDALAEDAAGLLAQLGAERCHWVGLSMGGFVGMRLAARRPGLLRSLALLNTAADVEPRSSAFKYRVLGQIARVAGLRPFMGTAMNAMFGRAFLEDPARREQRQALHDQLAAIPLDGAIRSLLAVAARAGVEDELARIDIPTLVIAGEQDVSVSPARAQRTATKIAGAQFQLVPHAGHSSTLEEPEAVSSALRAFLEKLAM